jgi:hypothetical protein
MEDGVAVFETNKLEVVPPQELKEEPVGRLVGHPFLLVAQPKVQHKRTDYQAHEGKKHTFLR